ncbi:preprotein translocase subunit SecD/SecD/SecF fusion protein [Marinococcus luteus]|uniref:Protein translocase subunit SecD n=1 Tax=Marinococcus luteus TaxID=1122204 RepID=A0A1H2S740_9BACI|nr:protein translocase subunit SecD [Marinococcus luteus]SDW27502.1 preprotein translocase subunit SecD/SecD/SecF fusion protein [Marinococcus luteus]
MVKKSRIVYFFLIIFALAALMIPTSEKIVNGIDLGLDLQGGFEVLYEVEPQEEGQEITDETLQNTVAALTQRVDILGVSEPNITIEGEDRIRVQLAGVEDQQSARELLSTEANLSIRDVDDNERLSGSDIQENSASVNFDDSNNPIVTVSLRDGDQFGEVTENIINEYQPPDNRLVIWLDYEEGDSYEEEATKEDPKFISAPAVDEPLYTQDIQIEGDFSVEEAENIADILNSGSLPVDLEEVYSNSVGASLGEQAMDKTIFATIIGVGLIFLFMLVFYRFTGFIAVLTLSTYIYFVLAVFNFIQGVLTLPGIAALVLGVGMAVDANIITYERIKEEIKYGRSILSAYRSGARRSLGTIIDANVTTLIAAGVLFYFGTSSVQGFALMLIVSILVSFITAVLGTRLLLGLWVNSRIFNKKPKVFGVKERDIHEP